ncbi:oxidoreductase [Mangrovactinospora gilvigrisea]|uniref:Oxidoreductase n=1 Tax=Mangrovactinospora gilvigrisea TaxID=1428644 RepID=A0A1J7CF43_9ACTN|nr:Gfo/Idh/MocA family oxidoreductase [Mangrovactinospora gilvigrisea]OIV38322.1 oxidoreductase [Mangrovactinospora gilvigrisea]
MIRTAMLSFWHVHARDYARQASEHPDIELVAAWDEDADRGAANAEVLGLPFHADLAELLARPDVDAVIVDTPTSAHPEVILAAIRAGKHVFTEKLLALEPAAADEILAAAERAGVVLTVSLPRLSEPATLAAHAALEQGLLGQLTQVRVRVAHNGAVGAGWLPEHFYDPEACGGGALIDLGAHPVYLARLFLGRMPEAVTASLGSVTGRAVDDNAVTVFRRDDGAVAIAETAFVNRHSPYTLELHGTEGSLLFGTPEARMLIRSGAEAAGGRYDEWTELPLPEHAPMPMVRWAAAIQGLADGAKPADNPDIAKNLELSRDLTALMDAAYRAARSGTETTPTAPTGGTR